MTPFKVDSFRINCLFYNVVLFAGDAIDYDEDIPRNPPFTHYDFHSSGWRRESPNENIPQLDIHKWEIFLWVLLLLNVVIPQHYLTGIECPFGIHNILCPQKNIDLKFYYEKFVKSFHFIFYFIGKAKSDLT